MSETGSIQGRVRVDPREPALGDTGGMIHHVERGYGESIVFLPVIGGDDRQFSHQLSHFGRDHRALAVTLRGNGRSPELDVAPDQVIRTQANDLLVLLDHLEVRRAHLVGTVYGGAVAMRFALDHPERVRTLTLVDTWSDGSGRTPGERVAGLSAALTPAVYRLPKRLLQSSAMTPYVPRWPEAAHVMGQFIAGGRLREQALQQRAHNLVSLTAELRTLAVPALGLVCDGAPWLRTAMHRMIDAIPDARLETVPRSLCPANLTNPDAFDAALRGFLEGDR